MRKCTHQGLKTMIIRVKRGARLLLLRPQGMRVLEMSDKEGSNDGPNNNDLPNQSVVGPDGLRQFVMLPK